MASRDAHPTHRIAWHPQGEVEKMRDAVNLYIGLWSYTLKFAFLRNTRVVRCVSTLKKIFHVN
jgi:hypothetical protein